MNSVHSRQPYTLPDDSVCGAPFMTADMNVGGPGPSSLFPLLTGVGHTLLLLLQGSSSSCHCALCHYQVLIAL